MGRSPPGLTLQVNYAISCVSVFFTCGVLCIDRGMPFCLRMLDQNQLCMSTHTVTLSRPINLIEIEMLLEKSMECYGKGHEILALNSFT